MKKYLCFFIIATICLLTSCKKSSPKYNGEIIQIEYSSSSAYSSDENTSSFSSPLTIGSYSSAITSSESSNPTVSSSGPYYANLNSKKFHKPECASAKKLKSENLYICESREQLIADGYSPCARCKP